MFPDLWLEFFRKKNLTNFRSELQNADWGVVYENNDVNISYNNFLNILTNAFERLFPFVKLSRKRMKDKPWFTSALKKSCRVKNYLYKMGQK